MNFIKFLTLFDDFILISMHFFDIIELENNIFIKRMIANDVQPIRRRTRSCAYFFWKEGPSCFLTPAVRLPA